MYLPSQSTTWGVTLGAPLTMAGKMLIPLRLSTMGASFMARPSCSGTLAVAPLLVAPLSVAPLSVAPLLVAPLSVAPLLVAPLLVAPLSVGDWRSNRCLGHRGHDAPQNGLASG